jgi:hypothetical protein
MGAGQLVKRHRIGLEAGKADRHGRHLRQRQQVQPGAKAQLGDVKAGPQPRGQVISGQKDMARLIQPAIQAEIRVVKAARDRNRPLAPVQIGAALVLLIHPR